MKNNSLVLAVDIGTTTIELSCFFPDKMTIKNGAYDRSAEKFHAHFENPQRLYGSDLLSRSNNAVRFLLADKMKTMVRTAIYTSLTTNGMFWHDLSKIIISGNTLMLHLFFGWDVSGMSTAPFTAFNLFAHNEMWDGIPVFGMPGISAFVGGDIVSGLYALSIPQTEKTLLFVDLGTNGEIVLLHAGRILAASVAAGPAFEGGNISIGSFARPGAIDSVSITHHFCRIHTIDQVLPPRGICGSGLIEAVYELYQDGIIDVHGSFVNEEERLEGFPLFFTGSSNPLLLTQNDIRSLQMGKSAIRAGIETLLDYAGLTVSDIDTLYLSGSFGNHIDMKKASGIGLIPKALISHTFLTGNTSLLGAIRLGCHTSDIDELSAIAKKAESISLADSETFKTAYIRYMDIETTDQ